STFRLPKNRSIASHFGCLSCGFQSDLPWAKMRGVELIPFNERRTASAITSGATSFTQWARSWAQFQLQPKHSSGRQATEVSGEYGKNRPKCPPPNTTTFGTLIAQAMCAPAESAPTYNAQRRINAAISRKEVLPAKLKLAPGSCVASCSASA